MAILAPTDTSLALPGFEHVQRFQDNERGKLSAKVLPGEYYVTQSDELISTVLGSCVAACTCNQDCDAGQVCDTMNNICVQSDAPPLPAPTPATARAVSPATTVSAADTS